MSIFRHFGGGVNTLLISHLTRSEIILVAVTLSVRLTNDSMHVCTVQTVHRLYLSVSLQSQISSTNSRSFSLFLDQFESPGFRFYARTSPRTIKKRFRNNIWPFCHSHLASRQVGFWLSRGYWVAPWKNLFPTATRLLRGSLKNRFPASTHLPRGFPQESVSSIHATDTWLPQKTVSGVQAGATWLPQEPVSGFHAAATWLHQKQLLASTQLPFNSLKKTGFFPAGHGTPTSSVENALLTALPQEGFHAFDTWWRGAALPVPLELVHVLPEDVARSQRANQVVELRLVLPPVGPAAAKKRGFSKLFKFWRQNILWRWSGCSKKKRGFFKLFKFWRQNILWRWSGCSKKGGFFNYIQILAPKCFVWRHALAGRCDLPNMAAVLLQGLTVRQPARVAFLSFQGSHPHL